MPRAAHGWIVQEIFTFFYRPAESCALGNNQKDLNKKKIESEIDKHKYWVLKKYNNINRNSLWKQK